MKMPFEHIVIIGLVVYNIIAHLFHQYVVQKLINKLMSRNYQEFRYINQDRAVKENSFSEKSMDGIPEDLGALSGIG